MKRVHTLLLTVVIVLIGFPAAGALDNLSARTAMSWPPQQKIDVPYEPTSEKVVVRMLDIATVGPRDLVYDLGCGDGRIVIEAVRRKGARGVGIDIDPKRIQESNENARKAGVTDRVVFIQQDLFDSDIGKATVVMLYLLPSVNLKLRPKLFRELDPGTRVVSHSHDMGDWKADRREKVKGHDIYFWVIPANVAGTWAWAVPDGQGNKQYNLKIGQRFQEVIGTFFFGNTEAPVRDIRLTGRRLSFMVDRMMDGKKTSFRYEGEVNGNTIEGTAKPEHGSSAGTEAWKAKRNPNAATAVETRD